MSLTPVLAEIIGPDILIILAIVVLLFGSNQLPKLARSLGSAKSEFERGLRLDGNDPAEPKPDTEPETVTLTHAELDALIAEREARGRRRRPAT